MGHRPGGAAQADMSVSGAQMDATVGTDARTDAGTGIDVGTMDSCENRCEKWTQPQEQTQGQELMQELRSIVKIDSQKWTQPQEQESSQELRTSVNIDVNSKDALSNCCLCCLGQSGEPYQLIGTQRWKIST